MHITIQKDIPDIKRHTFTDINDLLIYLGSVAPSGILLPFSHEESAKVEQLRQHKKNNNFVSLDDIRDDS